MTIQEILEAHKVSAFAGSDTACSCDRTWRSNSEYQKHLTEVLEQHMQERESNAWETGYGEGALYAVCIRSHLDGLIEQDPKRPTNPYRKESSDGR